MLNSGTETFTAAYWAENSLSACPSVTQDINNCLHHMEQKFLHCCDLLTAMWMMVTVFFCVDMLCRLIGRYQHIAEKY
jgi:hypothetical protein